MKKLKATKKITLTTLKGFAKRNENNILAKTVSSFNGMIDCVDEVKDSFKKTEITDKKRYYSTGIQGIYTVGSSRDCFEIYEDEIYFGIEVYNCCGTTILAIRK